MTTISDYASYAAGLSWTGLARTGQMLNSGLTMADNVLKKTGSSIKKATHSGLSFVAKNIKATNLKPITTILKTSNASLKHKEHRLQSYTQRTLGVLGLVDTVKKLLTGDYSLEKTVDAAARIGTGIDTSDDKDALAWLLSTGKTIYQELGNMIPALSSKEYEPYKKSLEKTLDFSKTSRMLEALGIQGTVDKFEQVFKTLEDPRSTDHDTAQAYLKLIGAIIGLASLANSLNIVKIPQTVLSGLTYISSLAALKSEIDTLHQHPMESLRDKTYTSTIKDKDGLQKAFDHHALVFRVKDKTTIWKAFENAAQPLLDNIKEATSPDELRLAVDAYAVERTKFTKLFGEILPPMGKIKDQLEKGIAALPTDSTRT